MMRKILLFISFFASTPIFIILCIVQFAYYSFITNHDIKQITQSDNIIYAALPSYTSQTYGEIGISDVRIEKTTMFFEKYGSILKNYSQQIVQEADNNNFDYRLLGAIAMQESQGCQKIPADSHNCWGYGITSKKTMKFSSYQEALHIVSSAIKKYYISNGLITPEQIGSKWNPDDNNGWIEKVNYFLNQF